MQYVLFIAFADLAHLRCDYRGFGFNWQILRTLLGRCHDALNKGRISLHQGCQVR
tara:strand:- start:37 stop:201 length:165 start_codon:yes stop_codon:yes gene_type:complete